MSKLICSLFCARFLFFFQNWYLYCLKVLVYHYELSLVYGFLNGAVTRVILLFDRFLATNCNSFDPTTTRKWSKQNGGFSTYTTQNLIRAKLLILFAGGPAYLI